MPQTSRAELSTSKYKFLNMLQALNVEIKIRYSLQALSVKTKVRNMLQARLYAIPASSLARLTQLVQPLNAEINRCNMLQALLSFIVNVEVKENITVCKLSCLS